jgi:hypothetical protein
MPIQLETVKAYFKENGCELLESHYLNSTTKMNYKCKCQGTPRITFDFIQKHFTEQNCTLLETSFIDSKTKMKYICKCGNQSVINWNKFQQGERCRKCCGTEKLTFQFVQNYFLNHKCKLLETEYKNNKSKMKYRCNCGNISTITFADFQGGHRCRKCSGTEKLTFEFVKTYFETKGCQLLETEYVRNNVKMRYICVCKNRSEIRFNDFTKGIRCKDCGIEKQQKVSKHFKNYTLPSGNLIRIQGYENLALDELLKTYPEDDIFTNKNDMPKIMYKFKGKMLRYYPDIYIKSENKIIEVKSTYTYKVALIKNMIKSLSTRKLGFDFEFWVYKDEKKNTFSKFII